MTVECYLQELDRGEIEESIRVDQQVADSDARRLKLISDFRVTDAAEEFLSDFLGRITGREEGTRRGWNHWLYGYYGSGKSHLLTLCDFLLDSTWVEKTGRDEVWSSLAGSGDTFTQLRHTWEAALDERFLQPLSLNLLKYQGIRDRSLSSLLVNEAHREAGLSSHPEVAVFEKWYRKTRAWAEREQRASAVLTDLGVDPPDNVWRGIRRYPALAHLVLPRLFEEEMGERAGFYDLPPTEIRPGRAVEELEEWRQELTEEHGQPAKLILLLDEVSLFVGARYQLVTELQALAENIDEQGQGEILSVVTAQARIQDVAPEAARHSVDFSILKDRFPHQYHLPSRHVGEIVQGRLLTKDDDHRDRLQEEVLDAEEATVQPRDTLVYREVAQNPTPRLDSIDADQLLDYYPFLPYHLPLFLEILHGLRENVADRAKSIFSGTARAALAVASALLDEWEEWDDPFRLISLPGFYDVVERELESAIPGKVKTIRDIEAEVDAGRLEEFDLKVAKAVLLLGFVDQMIDSTEVENLAVAVMDRLDGKGHLQTMNRVVDALSRLDTYIRKPEAAEARRLRFTESEERELLEEARERDEADGWDRLLGVVGDELWPDLMSEIGLPAELPYSADDDPWPVSYTHHLDGHLLMEPETTQALHLDVQVCDLLPQAARGPDERSDVVWTVGDEGRKTALEALRSWASLAQATARHRTPASVEDDLAARKSEALEAVSGLLRNGSFTVGPHDPSSLQGALREALSETYPDCYHPAMTEVDGAELRALEGIEGRDSGPSWVRTLELPTSEADEELGPIAGYVWAQVGRAISQHGPLSVQRLLEHLEEQEKTKTYQDAGVRPALAAVLWGLCRRGDFRPVGPEGGPVETGSILESNGWDDTRLAIEGDRPSVRGALERLPEVEPTDDLSTMRLKLAERLESLGQRAAGLRGQVGDQRESLLSAPVADLLAGFGERLQELRTRAEQLRDRMSERAPDWSEIVTDALDVSDTLHESEERWKVREAFLLHLDGLLAIGARDPGWISEATRAAMDTTGQEISANSGVAWWSAEGWSLFRNALSALDDLRDELGRDWDKFMERADRRRLHEKLHRHPWMRPAHELSGRLSQSRLERDVLQPLRRFDQQCGRGETVIRALCSSPADREVGELEEALDLVSRDQWFPDGSDEEVDRLSDLFSRLEGLVESAEPDEVAALGLWPADERLLRDALLELTTDREPSIDDVDGDLRVS